MLADHAVIESKEGREAQNIGIFLSFLAASPLLVSQRSIASSEATKKDLARWITIFS